LHEGQKRVRQRGRPLIEPRAHLYDNEAIAAE